MHNCWNNGKLISINRGLVRLRISYCHTNPKNNWLTSVFGKSWHIMTTKSFLGTIYTFCKHSSHSVIVWICTCWSWIWDHGMLSAIVTEPWVNIFHFGFEFKNWYKFMFVDNTNFHHPKREITDGIQFSHIPFCSVPFIVPVLYCAVECFETASNCCFSQLQFTKWGTSILYIIVTRKLYKDRI